MDKAGDESHEGWGGDASNQIGVVVFRLSGKTESDALRLSLYIEVLLYRELNKLRLRISPGEWELDYHSAKSYTSVHGRMWTSEQLFESFDEVAGKVVEAVNSDKTMWILCDTGGSELMKESDTNAPGEVINLAIKSKIPSKIAKQLPSGGIRNLSWEAEAARYLYTSRGSAWVSFPNTLQEVVEFVESAQVEEALQLNAHRNSRP